MPEAGASPPGDGARGYDPWVERWILPFVYESTLWPILVVLIGHAAAFLTAALLLALRDRRLGALAAVLGLLFLSARVVHYEWACRRRPAALSGVVLATWMLSGVLAVVADRYGVF
jgi:hypothetical protein